MMSLQQRLEEIKSDIELRRTMMETRGRIDWLEYDSAAVRLASKSAPFLLQALEKVKETTDQHIHWMRSEESWKPNTGIAASIKSLEMARAELERAMNGND